MTRRILLSLPFAGKVAQLFGKVKAETAEIPAGAADTISELLWLGPAECGKTDMVFRTTRDRCNINGPDYRALVVSRNWVTSRFFMEETVGKLPNGSIALMSTKEVIAASGARILFTETRRIDAMLGLQFSRVIFENNALPETERDYLRLIGSARPYSVDVMARKIEDLPAWAQSRKWKELRLNPAVADAARRFARMSASAEGGRGK